MAKHPRKLKLNPHIHIFWKELMGVKDAFFKWGSFVVVDATRTRLWEDAWLGDSLLANQYLSLYNILRTKDVTLSDVLSRRPLDIRFTRALIGDKLDSWVSMVRKLMG
jgi:hypothetical protein